MASREQLTSRHTLAGQDGPVQQLHPEACGDTGLARDTATQRCGQPAYAILDECELQHGLNTEMCVCGGGQEKEARVVVCGCFGGHAAGVVGGCHAAAWW